MKQSKKFNKEAYFACQVSSSVLGSIESLLVYARKEAQKEMDDTKRRQFLNDLQTVENWCFESVFHPKPSHWRTVIESSVNLGVVILAFIGFLAIT